MPAIGQLIQFVLKGTVDTSSRGPHGNSNSFCYQSSSMLPVSADWASLWAVLFPVLWEQPLGLLHADYNFQGVDVHLPETVVGPVASIPIGLRGGNTGTRLPANDVVFISLFSAIRGREWRGAKRVGPVAQEDQGDGLLTVERHGLWIDATHPWGDAQTIEWFPGRFTRLTPIVWSRSRSTGVEGNLIALGASIARIQVNRNLCSARHRRERTVLS